VLPLAKRKLVLEDLGGGPLALARKDTVGRSQHQIKKEVPNLNTTKDRCMDLDMEGTVPVKVMMTTMLQSIYAQIKMTTC